MALDRSYLSTEFRSLAVGNQDDGTITSGTAGDINHMVIDGIPWTAFVIGTQTILTPAFVAGANNAFPGLEWTLDTAAAGDGVALTPYSNHSRSPLALTISATNIPWFVELHFRIADVSGINPFAVGFKATAAGTAMQAHQATWADYTDKACISITGVAGACQIVTSLNNAAGDTTTDTTDVMTDLNYHRFRVNVAAAGVVTYQRGIGTTATGVPALAAPTTTAAFTFDDGDRIVPMIYYTQAADLSGTIELLRFMCGPQ